MCKIKIMIVLTVFLFSPLSFAHMMSKDSDCGAVAQACIKAGYARSPQTAVKNFWNNCMEPVLLGKSVKGVQISSDKVKACREHKITKMQAELKALQSVNH